MKKNGGREVYKWTLQQKALQDILAAFSLPRVDRLNLGDRLKLGQRGTSLLIDLIKSKPMKEVCYSDCLMDKDDLLQLRLLLTDQIDFLEFYETFNMGLEGTLLLKAVLKKKSIKTFSASDCSLSKMQIRNIVEALMVMENRVISELDFQGNRLGEEGIAVLKDLLRRKTIETLNLSHCYITATQLQALASGISRMRGVMEVLNVKGNFISRKDIEHFKKKVSHKVVDVVSC